MAGAALDYRHDPAGFIDQFIRVNEKGERWRLTAYQRRVIALAIRFDPRGRLLLRILLWSEIKKSGKTFIASCLTWWWAATHGHTEVLIVANDLEQSTSRVFATMVALAKFNGFERAKLCKLLATEIRVSNGTVIKAIASEYRGAAGSRHSLVVFDELWGYSTEALQRLFEELTPPPTETNAWMLIVTYAGFTGESTLLESLYARGLAGERVDSELECYQADDLFMFWSHTARQPWQDERYYAEQRRLLRPSTFLRLHENRWVTGTEAFITAALWDGCEDAGYHPALRPSGLVYVGVDAALKHDTAAVIAVEVTRQGIALVAHRIWKPTPGAPLDLEVTIEAYVRELHGRMRLQEVLCDPWQMARSIATLKAAGVPIREYPQTSGNLTAMGQALFDSLKSRQLRLYADPDMRAQALNTVAVDSGRGWKIAKEKASRKIDAIVALAMACVGAVTVAPPCACGDEECDGYPPFGLLDSAYVQNWIARHPWLNEDGGSLPHERDAEDSGASDDPLADAEQQLLDSLERWEALAVADDPAAEGLAAEIESWVVNAEQHDPIAGARLRHLLDQIEHEIAATLEGTPSC